MWAGCGMDVNPQPTCNSQTDLLQLIRLTPTEKMRHDHTDGQSDVVPQGAGVPVAVVLLPKPGVPLREGRGAE